MKACIIVSSECGIEAIGKKNKINVLPDRIIFSSEEEYSNSSMMNLKSFISRMKYDALAKPKIEGCKEELFTSTMDGLVKKGYDMFLFIMSLKKMVHYTPMIEEYLKKNTAIQIHTYTAKSISFPVCHMAMTAIKLLDKNNPIEEVLATISQIDTQNSIYLYSPEEDKIPAIEKFIYEEDVLKVEGNNNSFYVIHSNNVITYKVKEKTKTIQYYLDDFMHEIEGKDVIPFVLYTSEESRLKKIFQSFLESRSIIKGEVQAYLVSPEVVNLYGKNVCGIGYIIKK